MSLIDWGKNFVNACSANTDIDDLKNAAERGQQLVDAAKLSSAFIDKYGRASKTLEEASKGLGKVSEGLGKLKTGCGDIRAIMNIYTAMKVLNDERVIYDDPEKAAQAFGQLFVGFGTLAEHLPPPANQYAVILLSSGSFFNDMLRGLVPRFRSRELQQMNDPNAGELKALMS